MTEIRDVDALDHYWRPGALPRWAVWTIVAATATTILLAHLGAWHLAWYFDPEGRSTGLGLREGPAIALAIALGLAWAPRWRLSRALRVAVLLPVVQLAAIGASQWLWHRLAPGLTEGLEASPLVRALPFSTVIAATGAYVLVAGRAIAGRRRGEWLHASAMLALVLLLFVGLWMPAVAHTWTTTDASWLDWDHVAWAITDPRLIAWVVVPPVLAATAYTALEIRRYEAMRSWRGAILAAVISLGVIASSLRLDLDLHASLVYANFIHVMLAIAAVAGGVLIALGLSLRDRAGVRGITGVIEGQGTVACLQIAGWLRGPRMIASSFTVLADAGAVVVPGGAEVVCPPPDTTTLLRSGEAMPILRGGDRVVLAGFVAPPADHPFRGASALIPGPRIRVAREDARPAGFAGIALAMWRPCLAYLFVVLAIAVPALAGALGAR